MADGVPVWMVVAGSVVGLTAGTFDVVEKIGKLVFPERPEFVERYLIVETPNYDRSQGLLEQLQESMSQFGSYQFLSENSFPKYLNRELHSNSILKCKEHLKDVIQPSDCINITTSVVAFYGITNSGTNPLTNIKMSFSRYENSAPFHENVMSFSIVEHEGSQSNSKCFGLERTYDISGDCFSTLKGSSTVEYSGAVMPGETLLMPIYYGYVFGNDRVNNSQLESWFLMPNEVQVEDGPEIKSRPMSLVPTIRSRDFRELG